MDATHHVLPGETVFEAGDTPDYMYYVKSGTLHIERNDQVIAVVETNSVVGEMALPVMTSHCRTSAGL
ncbi:MAG: cyclic nucleotide-binding domain-containing protein [Chloroflexota bacterium]